MSLYGSNLGNILGFTNIQRKASRWRAGSWTFCSIVVFEAKDQEKVQIHWWTTEISWGLHLRHGPEERQEVQPVPGLAARDHGLQEGEDGQVLHDRSSSSRQQEVHQKNPRRNLSNMR